MNNILYSTGCPKCTILEKKLNEKEIPFEVCDSVDEMTSLGFTTVPVLEVDGTRMDFMQAVQWINEQ